MRVRNREAGQQMVTSRKMLLQDAEAANGSSWAAAFISGVLARLRGA